MDMNNYIGLTYPSFLGWRIIGNLWRGFMCPRKMHIFDEVLSDREHYLHCDACGFTVHIERMEE